MAASEPAVGRQKSREELDLELTERSHVKPKASTTACSVQVLTSEPEFGSSKPQQKQVQFKDREQQFDDQEGRLESDAPRCIGRAGTYHNPDPCPEFTASQNDEEFLSADHTPTTPVTATRRRLASISDGSRKPYINLHKVCVSFNIRRSPAWINFQNSKAVSPVRPSFTPITTPSVYIILHASTLVIPTYMSEILKISMASVQLRCFGHALPILEISCSLS